MPDIETIIKRQKRDVQRAPNLSITPPAARPPNTSPTPKTS